MRSEEAKKNIIAKTQATLKGFSKSKKSSKNEVPFMEPQGFGWTPYEKPP